MISFNKKKIGKNKNLFYFKNNKPFWLFFTCQHFLRKHRTTLKDHLSQILCFSIQIIQVLLILVKFHFKRSASKPAKQNYCKHVDLKIIINKIQYLLTLKTKCHHLRPLPPAINKSRRS